MLVTLTKVLYHGIMFAICEIVYFDYIVVGWVDNGAKFKETVLPICFIRNEHKYKLGQMLN